VLQDMQHVPLVVSSGPHHGVIGIGLMLHYSMACGASTQHTMRMVSNLLGAAGSCCPAYGKEPASAGCGQPALTFGADGEL
jgi:hypothetical protein